jgi:RNAse (barnase) inhibitor barstar
MGIEEDVNCIAKAEVMSDISSLDSSMIEGKTPGSKGRDQDRLWRIIFGNINRWIDEVYNLCQDERNVDRCIDIINILNRSVEEFQNLKKVIEKNPKLINHQQGGISWEVKTYRFRKQVKSLISFLNIY